MNSLKNLFTTYRHCEQSRCYPTKWGNCHENSYSLIIRIGLFAILACYISIVLSGCSGASNGLISITPEQYLASAKEQFETMDERDYEIRDLDEIIRILENAEKNAKKSETMDLSRMYLTLLHTMKARKQYQNAVMKGEYVANRPEPFYTINTKDVKETLRTAKKWLRLTNSVFKIFFHDTFFKSSIFLFFTFPLFLHKLF